VTASDGGFWQDRPVFVTGATGLAGGWLVKRLVGNRARVVCLVRDWVPESVVLAGDLLNRVTTVRGDVCDQRLLERTLGEYEIDTVLHLAAQTIVPIANRNSVSTWQTNVGGTWSLLEACRRVPTVKRIVMASSDKAYGETKDLPYTEETPLNGRSPYDASKSCADLIGQSYAATFGTPVMITRCGNFFGGGDLNWNRLVPGTIRSVLRGKRPVVRSDGKCIRDYFYVEDAANAYMLLAERQADDPALNGNAFNFSTEVHMSVLEVVDRILAATGSTLKPDIRNEAAHEIPSQYLNAGKARKMLKWSPLFTFEEGLKLTIDWYRKFLKA